MPLKKCTKDGKSGWQYGNQKCYTGPGAKKAAIKQGVKISYETKEPFATAEIWDEPEITTAELVECFNDLPFTEKVAAYISKQERDKIPDEDFGDPSERKYPVQNQKHLDSAAKLLGKAPVSKRAAIKKRLISIAKRKGLKIPKAWAEKE